MAKRSSRDIMADGFEEIDGRLTRIERLLDQILQVCRDNADGLSEHQHKVRDQVDRLGTRVLHLERLGHNGGE